MSVARGHSQSFQEVRSGVPAVCFPVDEQSSDEGVATPLHYPSLGHLPGKAGCPPLSELLWAMNTSHSCLRQFAAVSVSASASVVQLILCSVGQDEEISWNLVMCIWSLMAPLYLPHWSLCVSLVTSSHGCIPLCWPLQHRYSLQYSPEW